MAANNSNYIIIAVIAMAIGLLIFAYVIYRHSVLKKVSKISQKYKYLQNLNRLYNFKSLSQPRRRIVHPTKSYKSFQKISGRDVVLYHIENNLSNLRNDIAMAVSNKAEYDAYLDKIQNCNTKTEIETILSQKMNEKKFLKYEQILIKKNLLPIPYNIQVKLKIFYQSPKGRNYHEKQGIFKFGELATAYTI